MKSSTPRGIRNNNPLNIRIGNAWFGEVPNPTDKAFEQFMEMKYGVRAAFILLDRYINRYKLNTLAEICSRWAPKSENDTFNYIKTVANVSGIYVTQRLKFDDRMAMLRLFEGMCVAENGCKIDDCDIEAGYELALDRHRIDRV